MAFILCFASIQIIMMVDYLETLNSLVHCMLASFDAFIYAYGSQRVLDSGLEIFNKFYKNDKNYLVPMMISQKSLTFDGGIFNSSLDTYSGMLSKATSLATLLKSFVK